MLTSSTSGKYAVLALTELDVARCVSYKSTDSWGSPERTRDCDERFVAAAVAAVCAARVACWRRCASLREYLLRLELAIHKHSASTANTSLSVRGVQHIPRPLPAGLEARVEQVDGLHGGGRHNESEVDANVGVEAKEPLAGDTLGGVADGAKHGRRAGGAVVVLLVGPEAAVPGVAKEPKVENVGHIVASAGHDVDDGNEEEPGDIEEEVKG